MMAPSSAISLIWELIETRKVVMAEPMHSTPIQAVDDERVALLPLANRYRIHWRRGGSHQF
jgi:hypothetical protein